MGLPTEKLTAAVLRAVENGALSMNRAERLLGQMTFEATGKSLPGRGETTWRNEFTAVGISEALLDEAAFDMGLLEVTVGAVLLPEVHSGEVEAMAQHLRVLGDPGAFAETPPFMGERYSACRRVRCLHLVRCGARPRGTNGLGAAGSLYD